MNKQIYDSNLIQVKSFNRIDDYRDNFSLIKSVDTDLIYGNPFAVVNPLLSVIIPTYRRSDTFCDALKSILAQQPTKIVWECLIIDNTELDETGNTSALKEVKKHNNPHILYYHNSHNIGPGYNWNRGVELARGQWICFLHDDDVLCTDALQQIERMLKMGRKSKSDLGYLNARRVDFQGAFESHCSNEYPHFPQEVLTRFGVLVCGHTSAGAPTCGTTILKKAYMEAGGINYDFGPSADAVLCYQIMKNYTVVNSDCILGGYRWSDNAMLNVESLLNCIRADDLLMNYVYEQSKFAQLWGKWFADAISWRNVWRKNNIARTYHKEISREDFEKASLYPEPSEVKKNVYLVMYAIYRALRYLASYIATALNRIRIQTDD